MGAANILVVDDEPDIRTLVKEILEDEGFSVDLAEDAAKARSLFGDTPPNLVLLDIWMPDTDGITLLKEWKEQQKTEVPVVMMSGHGNVETAVEATRLGAYDFIEKPLSLAKLLLTVKHALEASSLQQENINLRQSAKWQGEIIGKSKLIHDLKSQMDRFANHDAPVLIIGAAGTNKEAYAYYLHKQSHRKQAPFISVNLSALSRDLAEVELFGSVKSQGYFDLAGGGTLFLRDITELDLKLQSQLQHVIEKKSYSHVGDTQQLALDLRIITATRTGIEEHVKNGGFRDTLFYQLSVLSLNVPCLCEHYQDIPDLLDYYVDYFVNAEQLPYRRFTVAAQNRLRGYAWPGNVRELKNLVQRLLILGNNEVIDLDEIEPALNQKKPSKEVDIHIDFNLPLRDAREQFEKAYLLFQLEQKNWSVNKVADTVGMERTHLYRKLRSLGINLK